ncbi:MAG TPA: hypothetical protein VKT28_19230 [Puia sp.]|nr:hypothetical protein [Puia sp.]
MKKLKLVAVAIIGMAFVSIVSCKKGDTGPAGARGPAGPDSVIYSSWIVLNAPFNSTDSAYEQTISAPALTQSTLSTAVILSYIGVPGAGTNGTDTAVINVSDAFTFFQGAYITQNLLPGEIDLFSNVDFTQIGALYRYVIVPGTILAGNSILKGYTKEQLRSVDFVTLSKALNTGSTKTTN